MSIILIRKVLMLIGVGIAIYGISEFDLVDLSYASNKDAYIEFLLGSSLALSNFFSNRYDLRNASND